MTHLPEVLPPEVAVLGTKFSGQPVVGGHIRDCHLPQDSALFEPRLVPTQLHSQDCQGVGNVSVLKGLLVGVQS